MALTYDVVDYDSKANELQSYYKEYEDKYGINTQLSAEEIAKLPQADQDKYAQASKEFSEDERIRNVYSILINLTIVITSISLLLAYVISDVIVPLFLKNGQTVGKKVFNIALMRVDGVKVSTFQLFVRAVLGKFTIETMLPVLLVMMMFFGVMGGIALIVVLLLLVLQIVVMSISKTNSAMHDLLAVTVAVDLESQRIFESEAALMEYKQRIAAEKAAEAPY
jgi:uncharacterized RDD family membrane protein YckC